MTKLDAFSAQIVRMVRNMPDQAILELVRNQLWVIAPSLAGASSSSEPARATQYTARALSGRGSAASNNRAPSPRVRSAKRVVAQPSPTRRRRRRVGAEARQQILTTVEQVIKASKGLSASEIAKKTSIPQARIASAVRELKGARRIHQGGDRRFARYAGDAKTAQKASLWARNNTKRR